MAGREDKPASCRERVQVVVRCRPMSHKEMMAGRKSCVQVYSTHETIQVQGPGKRGPIDTGVRAFTFDRVYDSTCSQRQLYQEVAHPLVQSVLHGYNGTVLTYGQTSAGKTFTMEGFDDPPEMRGLIPNAFEDIFSYINSNQSSSQFLVRASFLEIYNEEIRDLLATGPSFSTKLELVESGETGVYVKHLTSHTVHSLTEMTRLLKMGKKNRSVGATLMNQDSSRSHSIFTVTVQTSYKTADDNGKGLHVRVGKLNMVDLAGSERMKKAGAKGPRFKELTNINWSLTALGNVISALADADGKSTHIPYRDSKLTRLLQDSLGGNTKTVMVANIGPSSHNYEETISTLRYADRAKTIRNAPRINQDPRSALVHELQAEIVRLRVQLSKNEPVNTLKTERLTNKDPRAFNEEVLAYMRAQLEQIMQPQLSHREALSERNYTASEPEQELLTDGLLQQLKRVRETSSDVIQTHTENELLADGLLQQLKKVHNPVKPRLRANPDARPWVYKPGNNPVLPLTVYRQAPPRATKPVNPKTSKMKKKKKKKKKTKNKEKRVPWRLIDARRRAMEVRHRNFYL